MRKVINFAVRFWWIFPLATLLLFVVAMLCGATNNILMLVLSIVSIFSLLPQLVVFVILLFQKKWWRAVGCGVAGIASGLCCILPLVFLLMFVVSLFDYEPDNFGKEHPIPEGLEYNIPLGYVNDSLEHCSYATSSTVYNYEAEPIDSLDSQTWLQIWNDFQGGMYLFDFYHPALDDGTIFLRFFEVSENIELAGHDLRGKTSVEIANHSCFGQIANKQEFTIYAGDWGDYYAVRVEVWHEPTQGKPSKLMQKVYRMEGWMR